MSLFRKKEPVSYVGRSFLYDPETATYYDIYGSHHRWSGKLEQEKAVAESNSAVKGSRGEWILKYRIYEWLLFLLVLTPPLFGQTPTPGPKPQCTQPNWYQQVCDGSWNYADPSNAGHVTPSGCQAHNLLVADDTGANITIIGQCGVPCVGFQQVFKKPDHPSDALDAWNFYYTDPDAALHRHLFHYEGPGIPPPGFQVLTPYRMIGQLPEPPRTAKMNAYGCNVTPTPVPSPTRTPTPAPNIYAAYITWAANNGITSGCGGGNFCPDNPVTRAQMTTFLWNFYKAFVNQQAVLAPCQQQFNDVLCKVTP